MTFFLAKIILVFILPPAGPILIMVAGFLIVRPCRGCGRCLIAIGFISLYLFSIRPVSDALLKPLESYSTSANELPADADAIVVLGGGTIEPVWAGQPADPSPEALARLVRGIVLYRKHHLPMVLMGGNGDPAEQRTPDADAFDRIALSLGVLKKDIIIENKSRNTVEGARALNRLIRGKRIILVTSAYHMKRAAGMFRKQGFDVFPAASPYLSEQRRMTWRSFIPGSGSLSASSTACSEYISLFWYTLRNDVSPS